MHLPLPPDKTSPQPKCKLLKFTFQITETSYHIMLTTEKGKCNTENWPGFHNKRFNGPWASLSALPDYPGELAQMLTDTDRISQSPVWVTKSPRQNKQKPMKYIFLTYFGQFFVFWGNLVFFWHLMNFWDLIWGSSTLNNFI